MAPVNKKQKPTADPPAARQKGAVQKADGKRKPKQRDDKQPKGEYVSAYQRARQTFNRIQEERKQAAEAKQQEREQKAKQLEENLSLRRKMNKALQKRTKKGQPKLGAQMDILLQKIEKRLADEAKNK